MRVLALIVTLLAAGCAAGTPFEPRVPAALEESFELRVGQTAVFGQEPVRLAFESVAEDSRCPVGVQCVWQGNARIRLHLSDGSGARLLELNSGVDPRSAAELGYRVELIAVEPAPEANRPLTQDRYRVTLRVTRAQ